MPEGAASAASFLMAVSFLRCIVKQGMRLIMHEPTRADKARVVEQAYRVGASMSPSTGVVAICDCASPEATAAGRGT